MNGIPTPDPPVKPFCLLLMTAILAAEVRAQGFTESFDFSATATFPPTGWTQVHNGQSVRWAESSLTLNSAPNFLGADAAAHDYEALLSACDDFLYSPYADLSAAAEVKLRWDNELAWPSYLANGSSQVDVTADGGATWQTVWSETGNAAALTAEEVDLTAIAAGQVGVQLRFHYQGFNAHLWAVDNVELATIAAAPPSLTLVGSCPGTLNLQVAELTPLSPTVFVYSRLSGNFTVSSGPCAGLSLPLGAPVPLGTVTADLSGAASLQGTAPASACGVVEVAAVDVQACEASNVLAL